MVAFWQENTLNNRSHVALAGKELSGVVAVDWNLIQNINLQRVKSVIICNVTKASTEE